MLFGGDSIDYGFYDCVYYILYWLNIIYAGELYELCYWVLSIFVGLCIMLHKVILWAVCNVLNTDLACIFLFIFNKPSILIITGSSYIFKLMSYYFDYLPTSF